MLLNDLKNKKILILGFGREGIDTFLFLRKLFPKKIIGIADRLKIKDLRFKIKDERVKFHLGKDYLKSLKNYDIVIKSPGVPIHLPEVERAFREGKITFQTEIFLENCPGKIIGITGTKGKSTTTSLIYKILKAGGVKAYLVGNIGRPVLNLLLSATPKAVYVYELSAHQLYNLKNSPHISVFLNIYPEHLDYYKNLNEYGRAKANITLNQNKNDYLIFNSEDKLITEFAKKSKAKKIPIKGKYYELDKNAAREVGKLFKITSIEIEKAIKYFKPLLHRLELVGTFKGITFYNDALSTIPETAMFAIDTLGNMVETIMLGGYDRKIEFKNLAKKVLESKIKNIILFPTTGEKIWKEIIKMKKNRKVLNYFFVDNMNYAVNLAYRHTQKGKICLLSTASTSFSIFRDYKEKGNLFKKFVKIYGKRQ